MISAIVSAYHAQDYLDRRILNLFGQGQDIEVVIVCEANSVEHEIAKKYSGDKVKILKTYGIPKIGVAWNYGITSSTGEYITTANSDDRFRIDGLKQMAKILDLYPEIGLVFSQLDIEEDENITPWKRIGNATGIVRNIQDILSTRCIIGSMPLWRRSIHEKVGWFNEDYVVASDYDMWLRMAQNDVKFYYIAKSLGVYTRRPDSLEWRNKELCHKESMEIRCGTERIQTVV